MYLISTQHDSPISVPAGTSTIGRGKDCEICISGQNVSRQHCVITWRRGRLTVCDAGSANGIRVNGRRIETSELQTGDTLQVADLTFRVSDQCPEMGHADASAAPTSSQTQFDLSDPNARVWYFRRNCSVVGPAKLSVLRQWASAGEFTRSDEIRQEPSEEWFPADTLVDLFPPVTEP